MSFIPSKKTSPYSGGAGNSGGQSGGGGGTGVVAILAVAGGGAAVGIARALTLSKAHSLTALPHFSKSHFSKPHSIFSHFTESDEFGALNLLDFIIELTDSMLDNPITTLLVIVFFLLFLRIVVLTNKIHLLKLLVYSLLTWIAFLMVGTMLSMIALLVS